MTPETDVNLVALTPADMVPAQAGLVAWCEQKIRALRDEGDELDLHMKLAIANGWKTSVVTSSLNRNARRITYYEKMKAAFVAGYILVPNMPVDLLAVRVSRDTPPTKWGGSEWRAQQVAAQLLPAGEGRYVDNEAFTTSKEVEGKTYDGKPRVDHEYTASDYDAVDFPVALTKPIVLEAAARAMALRVFDQIGRVQNGGGRDPILVGQLRDPRGRGRLATFFIAWWVDTRTL